MSLPLLLGKNGVTAVLVIFMCLLEGFYAPLWFQNILSSMGIISEYPIISFFLNSLKVPILENKAFDLTAAKVKSKGHKDVVFKCLVEV